MTLTAIVIDDSPLQQMAMCKLINDNTNLHLIGSFKNPLQGLKAVNLLRPDVLFLDVEMPGLDGFKILELLEYDCQVIMNSTRPQFAINAFEYDAVKDYVTKPVKRDRFDKSIERAIKNQRIKQDAGKLNSIPEYEERLRRAS